MAITPLAVVDDDGSGETGTIIDAALIEQLEANIDAADAAVLAAAEVASDAAIAATKLDDLAAPDDNTDLNVSTSAHGLTPKITGSDGDVLTKSGTAAVWSTPTGGGGGNPTPQDTSATGAQNNFDLDARYTHLICTGAAPVFGGFTVEGAVPQDGDVVIIDNAGSGTVRVETEGGSSTAAHRAILPSARGQIIGPKGRMLFVYEGGSTDRWRGSLVDPGDYIAVAYNSGDFTGNGSMTWTVQSADLVVFAYQQRGRVVHVVLGIESSSVGGTPDAALLVAFPGGFTPSDTGATGVFDVAYIADNGTAATGVTTATATKVELGKIGGGNWAASTNATRVYLSHLVRVN